MSFEKIMILVMIQLIIVGWIDFRTKKISNYWIMFNLFLSILFYLLNDQVYDMSWSVLIFPLGFIVAGFILYLLNIMGAGDSKFLASLFLLTPTKYQIILFEKIILSTIFTGGILIIFRLYNHRKEILAFTMNHHWKGIRDIIRSRFSYAPVISVAWILLGREIWK